MSGALLANQTPPSAYREDDVSHYLQMIREYPRLSREEERELAKKCADGDEDAIRTIVCANLRLVVSVGLPLLYICNQVDPPGYRPIPDQSRRADPDPCPYGRKDPFGTASPQAIASGVGAGTQPCADRGKLRNF